MRIETLSDLNKLKYFLEQAFSEVPENVIIVSEPIIKEAFEFGSKTNEITKEPSGIKVWGISVMKEVAEIIK